MLLVNILLKLWSLNANLFAEKYDLQKLLAFFSKNTSELDIVLTRTVYILTTNELVKLRMLWTTRPNFDRKEMQAKILSSFAKLILLEKFYALKFRFV